MEEKKGGEGREEREGGEGGEKKGYGAERRNNHERLQLYSINLRQL